MPVLIPNDAAIYSPGTGYTGMEGVQGLLGSMLALLMQFLGGENQVLTGLQARNLFDVFVGRQRFRQYQSVLREVGAADRQKLIEFMQQVVIGLGGEVNPETDRMIRDFATNLYQYLPQIQQFLPADIMGMIGGSQGLMMQAAPYIQRFSMMQAGPFGALSGDTELIGRAIARSMLEEIRMRGDFAFEGFKTKEFGEILAYGQYLGLTPGIEVEGGRIDPQQMHRMRARIAEISQVLRAAKDMLSADGKEGSIVELFNLIETLGEGLLYAVDPDRLSMMLRRLDYTRRQAGFSMAMMQQLGELVNKQLAEAGAPGEGTLGVIETMALARAGYVRAQIAEQPGAMPINEFVSQLNRVAGRVFQGEAAAGLGALLQVREMVQGPERAQIDQFLHRVRTGQVPLQELTIEQIRRFVPAQFQDQFNVAVGPGRRFAVESFAERSQEFIFGMLSSYYQGTGREVLRSLGLNQQQIADIEDRLRRGEIRTIGDLAQATGLLEANLRRRFQVYGVDAEAYVTFSATRQAALQARREAEFAAQIAQALPSVRGRNVIESLFDAIRQGDDGVSFIGKILGLPDQQVRGQLHQRLMQLVPQWQMRLRSLYREYMDPNTTPERRREIMDEIQYLSEEVLGAVPQLRRRLSLPEQRAREIMLQEYRLLDEQGISADERDRRYVSFWRAVEFATKDEQFRRTTAWSEFAKTYTEVLERSKDEQITPWDLLQQPKYRQLREKLHKSYANFLQRQDQLKKLADQGLLEQRARQLIIGKDKSGTLIAVHPDDLRQALAVASPEDYDVILQGKPQEAIKLIQRYLVQPAGEEVPIYGEMIKEAEAEKIKQKQASFVREMADEAIAKAGNAARGLMGEFLVELEKRIENKVLRVSVENWVPMETG